MDICNQNQVCLWMLRKFRRLGGIKIDDLASSLDQRAGMIKRRNLDRSRRGGKDLRLRCCMAQRRKANKQEDQIREYFQGQPHVRFMTANKQYFCTNSTPTKVSQESAAESTGQLVRASPEVAFLALIKEEGAPSLRYLQGWEGDAADVTAHQAAWPAIISHSKSMPYFRPSRGPHNPCFPIFSPIPVPRRKAISFALTRALQNG